MANPTYSAAETRDYAAATPGLGPAGPRRLLVLTSRPADGPHLTRLLADGASAVQCHAVSRTPEAMRRLRRGGIDAVLVNGDVLKGGGLAELERLCELAGGAPVLLVADADAGLPAADAIRHGVQDVLRREDLTAERLALAISCSIERQRRFAQLRDLSVTDPLTGLHNRRGFRSLAEAHLKLLRRTQRQSLLLFADVDQLKAINDVYGHAEGDRALQVCAAALQASLRDSDVLARYGGDEFLALAIDVCDGAATVMVPRIANVLAVLAERAALPFALTLSVGTAAFGRGGLSLDEALARADHALYGEKRRRAPLRLVPAPVKPAVPNPPRGGRSQPA